MPAMSKNIRKVAVVMHGQETQFLELDQGRPLAAIIRDLCDAWTLPEADDHALQYTETTRQSYITERNRVEIQNGNVLKLTSSPSKTAQELLDKLHYEQKKEAKLTALKQLSELSSDITFAQEFINKQGLSLIISMVEGGSYSGEPLAYTLKAFVELMEHGIVSWDVLEQRFIKTVSGSVNTRVGSTDATTLQSALEILESIVLHSTGKYSIVEQEVTPVNLIHHLQSSNTEIQKNAIALINALFLKADLPKRKKIAENLSTKSIRNVILSNVIQGSSSIGTEMAHQLYVLQNLMFNLLDERMMTPIDDNDQEAVAEIVDLCKIAFDMEIDTHSPATSKGQGKHNRAQEYKKLGFRNHPNPAADFKEIPPGMLALDNMIYFARNHGESYTKVVLENSCRADEHDCPFAQASIELTKLLSEEILRVGEPPTEEGQVYYPMFFTTDRPFEEFYCICIQLFNKTWKEMKAISADFKNVLVVVKEQIKRALESQPATYDHFQNKLKHLTYNDILNIRKQERESKEQGESQAKPIVELREQITPEILDLIKQQRLNYLVEGSKFTKYSRQGRRQKDKFMYCRLSSNHKFLHYGDCDEQQVPSIEHLPQKLPIVDIKNLLIGKDCPHVKDRKGRSPGPNHAFTLVTEPVIRGDVDTETDGYVNFIAKSDYEFQMWTDGINSLLGNEMTSELTKQDLETLLGMEIKIRLLDTEGLTIPEHAPPIPKEPPNYDFYYK